MRELLHVSPHLPSHQVLSANVDEVAWSVVLTCEHASNELPEGYEWGTSDKHQRLDQKHWGVDLGAYNFLLDLMEAMVNLNSELLAAGSGNSQKSGVLSAVSCRASRLLVDCNRPLDSPALMRTLCDGIEVDLNRDLSKEEIDQRVALIYHPYHDALDTLVSRHLPKLLLSVHSFNPVYEGQVREVEMGILFDNTAEAQGEILTKLLCEAGLMARENDPWSGKDGLIHGPKSHAVKTQNSIPLLIEVRNDLLEDDVWRKQTATKLAVALTDPRLTPYCTC